MATVSSYTNSNTITYSNFNFVNANTTLTYIYDDDYDNYPSMKYPTAKKSAYLKIGSPTLTSLGVPQEAVITNVKLTEVSGKYYNRYYVPTINKMSINISDTDYSVVKFENIGATNFQSFNYDTGEISIPKENITNDTIYFLFEWYNTGTGFTYNLKTLYWEITYEEKGLEYKIKVGDGEITKIYLGSNEVSAIYRTDNKIY